MAKTQPDQQAMQLEGDFKVQPNKRDQYNRVKSWKLLGRNGERIVTLTTRADAIKLMGILIKAGL